VDRGRADGPGKHQTILDQICPTAPVVSPGFLSDLS
jgi:hypothetical protein